MPFCQTKYPTGKMSQKCVAGRNEAVNRQVKARYTIIVSLIMWLASPLSLNASVSILCIRNPLFSQKGEPLLSTIWLVYTNSSSHITTHKRHCETFTRPQRRSKHKITNEIDIMYHWHRSTGALRWSHTAEKRQTNSTLR